MYISTQVPLTKKTEAQEIPCNQKENSNDYKDNPLFWKKKVFFFSFPLPLLLTKFYLTVSFCFIFLFRVLGQIFKNILYSFLFISYFNMGYHIFNICLKNAMTTRWWIRVNYRLMILKVQSLKILIIIDFKLMMRIE